MRVFEKITDVKIKNSAVAMGVFDAIHVGHLKIVDRLKALSRKHKLESVILTFDPYPGEVFLEKGYSDRLLSRREKIERFSKLSVKNICFIGFSRNFARIDCETFVRRFLVPRFGIRYLVVGEDFTLGRDRAGIDRLKETAQKYGFVVLPVKTLRIGNRAVKSTYIRKLIRDGKVDTAGRFLGRLYTIEGTVLKGRGIGRKLDYATANISPPAKPYPSDGVYLTYTSVCGKKYGSVTYIGKRPTFAGLKRGIETYIFGLKKDIYGQIIKVAFIDKMREDKRFKNVGGLKSRIAKDVSKAKSMHRSLAVMKKKA